jgi:rhodanese-related sulfurtransferase
MRNLKTAIVHDLVRIMILLLSSLVLAIIVNTLHPMGLPLLLTEVKRPGIPTWVWNQLRYTDVQTAFQEVSTGGGILVDVRDRDDYQEGQARGAINLPYHGFEEAYPAFANKVSKKEHLFLYCYGTQCGLSARVAKRLLVLGFKNLTIIEHGFEAWKKSDLPIDKRTRRGDKHGADE